MQKTALVLVATAAGRPSAVAAMTASILLATSHKRDSGTQEAIGHDHRTLDANSPAYATHDPYETITHDRAAGIVGVVHIGDGAFIRAHTDSVLIH